MFQKDEQKHKTPTCYSSSLPFLKVKNTNKQNTKILTNLSFQVDSHEDKTDKNLTKNNETTEKKTSGTTTGSGEDKNGDSKNKNRDVEKSADGEGEKKESGDKDGSKKDKAGDEDRLVKNKTKIKVYYFKQKKMKNKKSYLEFSYSQ